MTHGVSAPLRRNDIVVRTDHEFFAYYGRVNRVLDADFVEVAWGKDGIRREPTSLLEHHNGYRGYLDARRGRALFRRMPSLRRLKQEAISWGRGAWARDRRRSTARRDPHTEQPDADHM